MIRSAKEFVELRTSTNAQEYLRAATEDADPNVWLEVLRDFPEMSVWVVRNKTVPMEILQRLVFHPDAEVRAEVATKNKLSADLMNALAADPDDSVRERIVYNKNVRQDILRKLAQDPVVRISSAAHERLRVSEIDQKWPEFGVTSVSTTIHSELDIYNSLNQNIWEILWHSAKSL